MSGRMKSLKGSRSVVSGSIGRQQVRGSVGERCRLVRLRFACCQLCCLELAYGCAMVSDAV